MLIFMIDYILNKFSLSKDSFLREVKKETKIYSKVLRKIIELNYTHVKMILGFNLIKL